VPKKNVFALPDWQRAWRSTDAASRPAAVHIRARSSDFQVRELLGYEFSGEGEHDYLLIEKQQTNTAWVARQLAAHAAIAERDVGYAGLKDRHSLSRQWFSVRRPGGGAPDWTGFSRPGVSVVECRRHRRKLRRGAHRANSFKIAMRNIGAEERPPDALLQRIATQGVPNYFGEQRFGRAAGNLELAQRLFLGRRLSRLQRSMALSAARAFIFNHILQERVSAASWNRLLPGDCASLDGSGSIFAVNEPDRELEERAELLDVHPSGALWGRGTSDCQGQVALLEQRIASRFTGLAAGLEQFTETSRRPLRLAVRQLEWRWDEDTLWLDFTLTRGGFATAVLREIADYSDAAAGALPASQSATGDVE